MNDDIPATLPDVPGDAEFAGTLGMPMDGAVGGYAQTIRDLAVKVRGEYELNYIPQVSDVRWLAGLTYYEALEAMDSDDSKSSQFSDNGPYSMDGDERYLGTNEQWSALYDEFEWVESFWAEAPGPEPSDFDSAVQDLVNSADALYNESTGVTSAQGPYFSASRAINLWSSGAATTFRDNIWYLIPNVIKRQAAVAGVMAHGLHATRVTWAQHRKSLKEIADKTIAALNAVEVEKPDNSEAALSILGGIVALAAIPFSGGGTIPVAAALFGAGASIYTGVNSLEEAKRNKVPLGDDTVSGVLSNMSSAVGTADRDAEANELDIINGLSAIYDRITDNSGKESVSSDIPPAELPPGNQPGDYDEPTVTPRSKYVIPGPAFVGAAKKLPPPNIPT